MLVLALDTTTRLGSHAVLRDHDVVAVGTGEAGRPHAERLPGELVSLLTANRLALADIDLLAVAAGPGSFTGLRIGIAAMQGLAFATGKPLVGVSTLDALASTAAAAEPAGSADIGVWMDAQRGEVFAALYRPSGAADQPPVLSVEDAGLVADPAYVARRWRDLARPDLTMIGEGALTYRAVLAAEGAFSSRIVDPVPPVAPAIARLALAQFKAGGTFHPHAIVPVYIRRPDAELARETKARNV